MLALPVGLTDSAPKYAFIRLPVASYAEMMIVFPSWAAAILAVYSVLWCSVGVLKVRLK